MPLNMLLPDLSYPSHKSKTCQLIKLHNPLITDLSYLIYKSCHKSIMHSSPFSSIISKPKIPASFKEKKTTGSQACKERIPASKNNTRALKRKNHSPHDRKCISKGRLSGAKATRALHLYHSLTKTFSFPVYTYIQQLTGNGEPVHVVDEVDEAEDKHGYPLSVGDRVDAAQGTVSTQRLTIAVPAAPLDGARDGASRLVAVVHHQVLLRHIGRDPRLLTYHLRLLSLSLDLYRLFSISPI